MPVYPGAFIAVGTPITGRPPHRSVREELPHTAPTLDKLTHSENVGTFRPRYHACSVQPLHRLSPAQCPSRGWPFRFLLGHQPSLHHLRHRPCGTVLFGDFTGTMPMSDFPAACASGLRPWPSPTDPWVLVPADATGISRFSCIGCPRMLRVFDSAGSTGGLR